MNTLKAYLSLGMNRPVFRAAPERACGETVVLVHGLAHRGWVMLDLARLLADAGYEARVYDYPSMHGCITDAAAGFRRYLEKLAGEGEGPIHLVTHSMGGLVARGALGADGLLAPERRGRWVMLAVPHGGSPAASRWCRERPRLSRWLAPFLFELQDTAGAVPELPRPAGWRIGSIVGLFDGKVPAWSSAYGEGEIWQVASGHSFIMNHRTARKGLLAFLETGEFPENRGKNPIE